MSPSPSLSLLRNPRRDRASLVAALALAACAGAPWRVAHAEPLPLTPEDPPVSETHSQNMGRVVFVREASAIEKGKEKPSKFESRFKITDPIYYRAYGEHSLKNTFLAQGVECRDNDVWQAWWFEVDGKPLEQALYLAKIDGNEYARWTSFRSTTPLFSKVETGEASLARAIMERLMPVLTPGTHKMTFKIGGRCMASRGGNGEPFVFTDPPMATGEFTLEIGASDLGKVSSANGGQMPKAGRSDPKLAHEMEALLKREWKDDQILKAVVVDKDWSVERAPLTGIALRRTIKGAVAVKQSSGVCKVFDVLFGQEANRGKASFGATTFAGTGGNSQIPCANVK